MRLLLFTILTVAAVAEARTTLRIPVVLESGRTVAELNLKLSAQRAKPVPEVFEISSDDKDVYKKYEAFSKALVRAGRVAGLTAEWSSELFPNSDFKGTCYTGTGGAPVVELVFALAGSFYTEQLNLWGWKYKNKLLVNPELTAREDHAGDALKSLNKNSKLWREWRGQGEAVLVVVAYGDSGDDFNSSIIPRCD